MFAMTLKLYAAVVVVHKSSWKEIASSLVISIFLRACDRFVISHRFKHKRILIILQFPYSAYTGLNGVCKQFYFSFISENQMEKRAKLREILAESNENPIYFHNED